jgi:hypothetical protein
VNFKANKMKVKKIYITGCARSGTTLLARMFHAFEDVLVMSEEVQLKDFIDYTDINPEQAKVIVGKRTENSIFSNILSENETHKQLEMIDENDIIIINCVRDGRFVVESWWKAWSMYNPFAWMSSIMQSFEYQHMINLTVKFETLVKHPAIIQNKIENLLGFQAWTDFENYPSFVGEDAFQTKDEKYKLRKMQLDQSDIPFMYLQKPNNVKYFDELLKKLGY